MPSAFLSILAALAALLGLAAAGTTMDLPECTADSDLPNNAPVTYNGHKLWYKCGFPNPMTDPEGCGRNEPSTLCDPDKILQPQEASELDQQLAAFRNDTPCICGDCEHDQDGLPLWLVVVQDLAYIDLTKNTCTKHAYCNESYPKIDMAGRQPRSSEVLASVADFAEYLSQTWSYRKDCNVEAVLMYVAGQSKLYIAANSIQYEERLEESDREIIVVPKIKHMTDKEKYAIYAAAEVYLEKGRIKQGLDEAIAGILAEYAAGLTRVQINIIILASILGGAAIFGSITATVYYLRAMRSSGRQCRDCYVQFCFK